MQTDPALPSRRGLQSVMFALLFIIGLHPVSMAQESNRDKPSSAPASKWSPFARGGYVYQFQSDIDDDGGNFRVNRLVADAGIAYALDYRRRLSFALGYGLSDYDFSGAEGFAGLRPWRHVDTFGLSASAIWGIDQQWTVFIIPSLKFSAERGAALDQALSGGGFVGFSYRFSKRLTIGPGIGVITQLEDDPSIFPVLIINWQITDRLTLETGRGLGATLGPGLSLSWKANDQLSLSVGGRFERLRFRLDDDGARRSIDGIGDDRSFPLFAGATYHFSPQVRASLVGGVKLGGEVRLEDKDGDLITKGDYKHAGFLGLTLNARF